MNSLIRIIEQFQFQGIFLADYANKLPENPQKEYS